MVALVPPGERVDDAMSANAALCPHAAGTVISSTWPKFSTATFEDHVTARHGTGATLQDFYGAKHRATASCTECGAQRLPAESPSLHTHQD